MKKISAFLVGGLIASTVLAADPVTSVNMVGYVNQDLLSNKLHFTAIQMPQVGGSNQLFTSVIGNQLPISSWAYFWNSESQTWVRAQRTAKGGWGVTSNRTLSVGEGFFVISPSNMTVNIAGEVPTSPTSMVSLVAGYNAVGYMYPVSTPWTNTSFFTGLPISSWLNIWDDNAGWTRYQRTAKGGWGSGTNLVLQPGQGFFVIKSGSTSTNLFELRPFTP